MIALLALGLSLLPLIAQGDEWPQWRGPNRDGTWPGADPITAFPPDGLKLAWRAPVGRGWSSPVVAQGKVFLTAVNAIRPKAEEHVLAFDSATGKLLWIHKYPVDYPEWAFDPNAGGPRSTPIIRDGKLYTLGALGHLFCFDAGTGNVLWEKNLAAAYQVREFTAITASPLIDDELLILYICGKPAACVIALDKNSGKEVWRALDDSFTYSSPIVIHAAGQKQLIVWTQQAVTSLNPLNGHTWWRQMIRTSGDQAIATPVSSGDFLLVGGLMLKLGHDQPSASLLWPETKTGRILSNTSTALLSGTHIYSAKTSGELVCLDARTGTELWSTNTITTLQNGSSIHLTPTGNSVLLFTDRGDLILSHLSPTGYREISRAHLIEPTSPFGDRKCAWSPPAFANGHVYVRNDTELVSASLPQTNQRRSIP